MTLWSRISAALSALRQGEGLASVFDRLRNPPERTVAFTIAVIALGAKIAKADGQVTRAEVVAFREIFRIGPEDEANAARVYDLARQDVAGYRDYAARIATLFADQPALREEVLDGLFHIALADGRYHDGEDAMLADVAAILGLDDRTFMRMRARFVPEARRDPWDVLGVARDDPPEVIRAAWARLVRESHPDHLIAQGLPVEAVRMAEARLVAVNRAWEEISRRQAG
ncbi:MAG: molecular chaperone DjiA [Rubellimicrobium sp.]|nr:molecular chaperone DjiA [Rubellimicrobium sp.]